MSVHWFFTAPKEAKDMYRLLRKTSKALDFDALHYDYEVSPWWLDWALTEVIVATLGPERAN